MITGYYVRERGGHSQLIRQNERYEDEVLVDGLTHAAALKLYWRKMAELHAPIASSDRVQPRAEPEKRPPAQLLFDP